MRDILVFPIEGVHVDLDERRNEISRKLVVKPPDLHRHSLGAVGDRSAPGHGVFPVRHGFKRAEGCVRPSHELCLAVAVGQGDIAHIHVWELQS